MTTSIHCSIVSAEQEIFAGTVQRVIATGSLGDIGVYPGHTPLLTGIQPGPVKLTMEDGSEEMFFASGGFLEVQPTSITLLADTAIRADDIDEAAAQEAERKARQARDDKKTETDFAKIDADLAEQAAMLRTIRKLRERKNRA